MRFQHFYEFINLDTVIGNGIGKGSLRGAERRGNLMRLLHFVRNDDPFCDHLFKSFTIVDAVTGLINILLKDNK
jgi:hypothetical protein